MLDSPDESGDRERSKETSRRRAVTQADVARYAGVSTAVVSYVVNQGPKTVAPQTAARVREAIDLLDYQPNINAQALRRGTTEMIGLVLSDSTNPFFTEFAAAIGSEALGYGHALMIAGASGTADTEAILIEDLVRRQVDGLIVASVYARPDLLVRAAEPERADCLDRCSWRGTRIRQYRLRRSPGCCSSCGAPDPGSRSCQCRGRGGRRRLSQRRSARTRLGGGAAICWLGTGTYCPRGLVS